MPLFIRLNPRSCDASKLVVSRYTEIPNRYPIFSNTDTDTDVGISNTENTENLVRYSPSGAVSCVTKLPLKLDNLISSYWYLVMACSPPRDCVNGMQLQWPRPTLENELVTRDVEARDRDLWDRDQDIRFSVRDETKTLPDLLETQTRPRRPKTASRDRYFILRDRDRLHTWLIQKKTLSMLHVCQCRPSFLKWFLLGLHNGSGAPLFPPCPFTSPSFPLFTFSFLSLALPIFFFCPSLSFLP